MEHATSQQDTPFIIVGLGNPEDQYQQTPHNIGFDAADELLKYWDAESWKLNKKVDSHISKTRVHDNTIVLAKPTTYMNASGKAVVALMKWYNTPPEKIIIIHDDIDIPLGTVKVKRKGSSGGHRGIESIIEHLHTNEFTRIKIGVGFTERPIGFDAKEYVLKKMSKEYRDIIQETLPQLRNLIENIV